jgi:2-haloacid dehalogenase
MANAPVRLVLFDVNETLTDLSALGPRLEQVGASADVLPAWFAGVLRDGFALTAAGAYADFREIADAGLRAVLSGRKDWSGDPAAAAAHVLDGFAQLPLHPDIDPGVRALHAAGLRLATLTNGSIAVSDAVLRRAGLRDYFEALLDVAAPRAWKPSPRSYHYAARQLDIDPAEALLVAVHPWDIDGARRAGLQAAWLQREAASYPPYLAAPTYGAKDLRQLADLLVAATSSYR